MKWFSDIVMCISYVSESRGWQHPLPLSHSYMLAPGTASLLHTGSSCHT